jgi:hypothetical protein
MPADVLTTISTVSTAAASIFAAVSAWIARDSARAAEAAVEEARKARQAEVAPRLVLEKDFLDFIFQWPHPQSLNGEAVFLSRKHWKDSEPSRPTFSLRNFGESPALEVAIAFDLQDPNGELYVPPEFAALGLSVMETPATPDQHLVKMLQYSLPSGQGAGLPLYRRWTTDVPNCSPGQAREIEFPVQLLNVLFLRGLQYWSRRGTENAICDIVLTVQLSCHAIDGAPYGTQFRFKILPFFLGQTNPLIVHGHCNEMPMYPKPDGPRVA